MPLQLRDELMTIVEQFDISGQLAPKLFFSLVTIIVGYLIAYLIVRVINNKVENYKHRHQGRKYTYYLTTVLVFIGIAFIWLDKSVSWSTFFGFLSAGLALALHQVLLNIAGWSLIVLGRPFNLGDRIEVDGVQGDVIDIQVFYTTLLEVGNWVKGDQSTGRVVNIPNGIIFRAALFNYTTGFEYLWNEVSVLVSFQSDWEKAKAVALEIGQEESEEIEKQARNKVKQMSKRYMIKYGKFTPIVYIDIKEYGVEITLRYLTSARKRREIANNINRRILNQFQADQEIEIAYPTRTIYHSELDGEKNQIKK